MDAFHMPRALSGCVFDFQIKKSDDFIWAFIAISWERGMIALVLKTETKVQFLSVNLSPNLFSYFLSEYYRM